MKMAMLSTIDNPYSPFDDFAAWYNWDVTSGYYTTEFLGRILTVSSELSESDYNDALEQAIDEIVRENVLGVFIKVEKEIPNV